MELVLEAPLVEAIAALAAAPGGLPRRTEKPWGYELLWAHGDRYAAKILHIEAGYRLSFQYHRVKEETMLLVRGRLRLELEGTEGEITCHEALPGQVFHIPAGRSHRLTALETCDVLEVSTPELEDLVRLQDDFGRV
jgi:mannose-6-phosphate isomerase-like protein (cupin superfamily)